MPQQAPYQQYPQQGAQYGQQMVLHCPTCHAMAPLGTAACVSCHTSLVGIPPMPTNQSGQGQQGGFLQGGGQMLMGALGGAAAVIGGEMLMHGMENVIENQVEGDIGFGQRRHHHHHREEGLLGGLGGLGHLIDDVGL
jgi:hypothetical protein